MNDIPASNSRKAAIVIGTSAAALTLAALCGLAGFFIGQKRVGGSPGLGGSASVDRVLVEFEGRRMRRGDLPEDVRAKLEAADARREEVRFQAEYDHGRAVDNALRAFVVSELAKRKAEQAKIPLEEATRTLAAAEPAGVEDARALFEASDPSASPNDFERVKGELLAYIEEVSRREAADRLLASLEASETLKLHLERPRNPKHAFELEGFPMAGNKDAPLTLVNFTDFLCDECASYNLELASLVASHGLAARFVFIPFPYTRPDKAMGLARGAMCAHEQGAYIDYHMKVVGLGDAARKADPLRLAREAGLDAAAFDRCYRKGTGVAPLLAAAQTEARRAGVWRVPVTFVGNTPYEGKASLAALGETLAKGGAKAK